MYIKSLMKRFAAVAAAAVVSLSLFGGVGLDNTTNNSPSVINGAAVDENADYEAQLADLEAQKTELDNKIAEAGSDMKGQQEKLDAVNEKAKTIRKKITKLNDRSAELEDEMCRLDDEMRETRYQLEQSEADIAVGIEEFKGRLRAMYVAGNDSYSEVLINADNFYDVLMRVELLKRVAAYDSETIDGLLEQKAKIEEYQAELDEQSAALKEKSADYAAQQADLAQQQSELLQMQEEYGDSIEALSGDLSSYQQQMDKLSDEYNKVSEAAKNTTTTTTTTTAKTEDPDEKTTTTKKDSSSKPDDVKTSSTTTKREEEPSEPEPPKTTTAPTTTTPKPTTTPAPEPEPEPDPAPSGDRQQKINTVVSYAKSMVGGRYVWGGNQFAATDCSGLVMLSYAQIGISLPHLASAQAGYGTTVSYSDIQPGDLVFYGGSSYSSIYHVSMYIGDGKIVHAESSATGIVISYYDSVARYNNVTCIKRLI